MSSEIESTLPRFARCVREGIDARLHLGVAIYVALGGEVVVDGAMGESHPGQPLTADQIIPWLSAGKPLTAAAIMQQVACGALDLDETASTWIPEFGQNGKESVTLRQLLTHTAGIQPVETGWPGPSWGAILDRICRARLRHGFHPGRDAAYDPLRSWFVLGEILHRLEGEPVDAVVRQSISRPVGMSHTSIAAADQQGPPVDRFVPLYQTQEGRLIQEPNTVEPNPVPSPGSSVRGPVRDLGAFYQMLLDRGRVGEATILPEDAVEEMTRRQREGLFDGTFQHVVDFGLGLIVNSNRYGIDTVPYGFGRYSSPRTFGHGGAQSSIGFADPDQGLVAVIVANGRPGEARHQERNRELTAALYVDLRLA